MSDINLIYNILGTNSGPSRSPWPMGTERRRTRLARLDQLKWRLYPASTLLDADGSMAGTQAPVAGNELEVHRWRNKAPHVFLPALLFPVQSRAPPALPRAPRDASERNSAAERGVGAHELRSFNFIGFEVSDFKSNFNR
jgi:hypothetical protein